MAVGPSESFSLLFLNGDVPERLELRVGDRRAAVAVDLERDLRRMVVVPRPRQRRDTRPRRGGPPARRSLRCGKSCGGGSPPATASHHPSTALIGTPTGESTARSSLSTIAEAGSAGSWSGPAGRP